MRKIKETSKRCIAMVMAVFMLTFIIPEISPVTNVEAASIKLSSKKITLIKGQSKTLKLTGTKKKPKWSSSKKSVATVSSKGKVVAKNKGTAKITAKIDKKKYTCTVVVETPSLNRKSLSLRVGQTYRLKLSGTKQKIKWKSKNKSVASISSKGVVTGNKEGSTYVTAGILGKEYKCLVKVKKVTDSKPEDTVEEVNITLNKTSMILFVGETDILTAKCTPEANVTWVSSNSSIASVEDGIVTAKKFGTVKITAKSGNSMASCTVDVEDPKISETEIDLVVGDRKILTIEGTSQKAEWTSSNKDVATVDNDGLVVAVGEGTATIIATIGGMDFTCKVKVGEKVILVENITLNKTSLVLDVGESEGLTATVVPNNATNQNIVWSTSDANVATVDHGIINAVAEGTATITASIENIESTCYVQVNRTYGTISGTLNCEKGGGVILLPKSGKAKTLEVEEASWWGNNSYLPMFNAVDIYIVYPDKNGYYSLSQVPTGDYLAVGYLFESGSQYISKAEELLSANTYQTLVDHISIWQARTKSITIYKDTNTTVNF